MLHKIVNTILLGCLVIHWIDLSIFPLNKIFYSLSLSFLWLMIKTNLDWKLLWWIDPWPCLRCDCILVTWECYQAVLSLEKFVSNIGANTQETSPSVWLWLHFNRNKQTIQSIHYCRSMYDKGNFRLGNKNGLFIPWLNQFAHIATQNNPTNCSKTVKVSSLHTGKCSSILPKSWANLFNNRPGGLILKNLIGDLRRPARAISWTFRVAIITSW